MAASNTNAATAATATPKKKGLLLPLLLIMPVALLLLPSTLVLVVALVPTLVARIVEPGPSRHLTITVGCLNLAGSLWFLHELWSSGQSFSAVMPTLSDVMGWLSALVGAGLGWMIYSMMPALTRSVAIAKSNLRLGRVRKAQRDLVDQWGEPVRGGAQPPTA